MRFLRWPYLVWWRRHSSSLVEVAGLVVLLSMSVLVHICIVGDDQIERQGMGWRHVWALAEDWYMLGSLEGERRLPWRQHHSS